MTRKEQLPSDISSAMDDLLKEAGQTFRAGDPAKAVDLAMAAWNLMPEPVEQWDFYPQVQSRNMVTKFTALEDKESVHKWTDIMARMYDDPNHEDQHVLMVEGEAMYKLGDFDRAFYVFDRIFDFYGKSGFRGEAPYLEFYLKQKAARNG